MNELTQHIHFEIMMRNFSLHPVIGANSGSLHTDDSLAILGINPSPHQSLLHPTFESALHP